MFFPDVGMILVVIRKPGVVTDLLPRPAAIFYWQLVLADGHKTHPYGFTVCHRPTSRRIHADNS